MGAQPMLVERRCAKIIAIAPEGMKIPIAPGSPIGEFDAKLEGGARRLDERVLVDLRKAVEQLDWRDRRLSHADRTDFIGFDQSDCVKMRWQNGGKSGRSHP